VQNAELRRIVFTNAPVAGHGDPKGDIGDGTLAHGVTMPAAGPTMTGTGVPDAKMTFPTDSAMNRSGSDNPGSPYMARPK
jgi:hypothetical protein